jgi:Protein of unknown function (DUF2796)
MDRLTSTGALVTALLIPVSAAAAASHSHHAHVHGIATLQIAVDGDRLTIDFSTPLDNLVGFERAPRTEREKAAASQALQRLRKPEDLLIPSPEARCVRTSVKIDAPVLDAQAASDVSASKAGAAPLKDKGKRTEKSDTSEHAGLSAEIMFRCAQPQNLKSLSVALFDAFPALRRVDTEVAGAGRQVAAKLTPRNRTVSW